MAPPPYRSRHAIDRRIRSTRRRLHLVATVSFRTRDGWQQQDADLLLLHDGVIPSVQITHALGCDHTWSHTQRCWHPTVDAWGTTSIPNVLAAGDRTGIAGALASVLSGRIAALGVAHALDVLDTAAAPLRAERARHLAVRPSLA